MARLLGIRIQNYKSFENVGLGQVEYARGEPLPRFACFIGPNGSGKSTLLDAFGFVADCLLEGVEAACDKPHRGGFDRLRTQGAKGPIAFEIFFDSEDETQPIVYAIEIDLVGRIPKLTKETLRQRRIGQTRGKPYYFLKLDHGAGKVWTGEFLEGEDDATFDRIQLSDLNRMALATLGNLASHPRIVKLRTYIEQWYLSYFVPDAARTLPPAGAQPRLDRTGSNVGNVLQHFESRHKAAFKAIIQRVTRSIPGLRKLTPRKSQDNRLLLEFDESGYQDPFYQQSMSDGTLKMLAYAVLLADPQPRPFIGIEEPENGLYVELVEHLARLFVGHTDPKTQAPTQMFVTTHSPYFVNSLRPEQVWIMEKQDGRAVATHVSDIPVVTELTKRGVPLGSQWYSHHFDQGRVDEKPARQTRSSPTRRSR